MTTITFDNPTGLSPIIGDFTPSATLSRVCKAYLRKRDIRPYSHPQSTARVVTPNRQALMQNPVTGVMFTGSVGSAFIADNWNGSKLTYAVLDGLASLREGDSVVGDFNPPRATTPPVIQSTAATPPATLTTQFEACLDTVSSEQTPVNNLGLDTPWFIRVLKHGNVYHEFPLTEVQRALNWVLDNYKVTYANGVVPLPLRFCLNTMLATLNSSTTITRHADDTNYTYPRSASVQKSIHGAIAAFTETLGYFVLAVLEGNFTYTRTIPVCPLDYNGSSSMCPRLDVAPLADPAPYTTGSGVPTHTAKSDVLPAMFVFAASVWSTSYGFSNPLTAVGYGLAEMQACYAAPSTYVWNGLTAAAFTSTGELQPYVLGSETMRTAAQDDPNDLARGYCYTFVDAYGREGVPSLATFVDDAGVDTRFGVVTHRLAAPTNVPQYAAALKLYRALAPKETKSSDDVVWQCVSTYALPITSAHVEIPDIVVTSYETLETLNDAPVANPKFLCVTGTDHAVCLDDGVICFSKRHKFYAFPYDRRIELPSGIKAVALKAVDNIVYVGTDSCPMVIVVGEDHGDAGLQLEETLLRHAPYGVASVGSFATTPFGVMYWSKVGVIVLAGKNISVATASILDEDQVPAYLPNTAVYQNGMYLSFRDDVCTVLDVPDPTFAEQVQAPMTQAAVGAKAVCLGMDGLVYLAPVQGYTCKVWEMTGGIPMDIHYKTYNQLLPNDTVFHAVRVYGSGISGTLRGYDEVGQLFEVEVDSTRPMRLPRHIAKNHVALEFLGNAACISKMVIATAMEELI
ncbi:MAG: hypothetical protein ACKO0Z_27125 [Betaproteobacteria bacterium]